MELEIRASGTLRAASPGHLTGYAAVFGSEANLGDFIEIIRPGAFAKSLESGMNIRALYHHEGSALLGTTRGGTLKLAEDSKGLRFDLALPGTTHGKDLAILVDRGDVAGCSFGFRVREGGDRWEDRGDGSFVRELLSSPGGVRMMVAVTETAIGMGMRVYVDDADDPATRQMVLEYGALPRQITPASDA